MRAETQADRQAWALLTGALVELGVARTSSESVTIEKMRKISRMGMMQIAKA